MPVDTPVVTKNYTYFALEHFEHDVSRLIDLTFKQLQGGVMHCASWDRILPQGAVQYLSANKAIMASGSYPEQFTALHIPLNETLFLQNGLAVHDNCWTLLGAGQENYSGTRILNGGSIYIVYIPTDLVEKFKDYFDKDISYPKSSAVKLYPSNAQHQNMVNLVSSMKRAHSEHNLEHIFDEITEIFIEVLFAQVQKKVKTTSRNRYHRLKLFEFIRQHLNQHYKEPLTMDGLCKTFNVTHRTLDRIFQAELGMPPMKYLMYNRLHAARKMLFDVDAAETTIEKIAQECGFTHMGRFSTCYKQHYGISPSEFRRLRSELEL